MGAHIVNGQFQSDKYPTCPPGKVPLSVRDLIAQDLLWEYAQRRRKVDAEFSDDLEQALLATGFLPTVHMRVCYLGSWTIVEAQEKLGTRYRVLKLQPAECPNPDDLDDITPVVGTEIIFIPRDCSEPTT